jgi:hypothetical protein
MYIKKIPTCRSLIGTLLSLSLSCGYTRIIFRLSWKKEEEETVKEKKSPEKNEKLSSNTQP